MVRCLRLRAFLVMLVEVVVDAVGERGNKCLLVSILNIMNELVPGDLTCNDHRVEGQR